MAKVKIVWNEGNEAHAIVATPLENTDPDFLQFILADGRMIRLNKDAIVKVEEVRG